MSSLPAVAGTAKAGIWLIPIADERVSVQAKTVDPLRTRAIPERF